MPTVTIPVTAISIQSPKEATKYGALASIPLRLGSPIAHMLGRAALTGIPTGATVESAFLRVWQRVPGTGSVQHQLRVNTSNWSTATTYRNRPYTSTSNQVTLTRSAPARNSLWSFDFTVAVQAWVSGAVVNNGFTIMPQGNTGGSVHGHTSVKLRPELVITYVVGPTVPTALHPGGTVSKAKPTLTFQVADDTTAVQVQVDPDANATTPAFTTPELVTSAGLVDLAQTSYPGLADLATTRWRARARNGLGWSAYSGWATMSRRAWADLSITSPTSVTEDPSPTVGATYAGNATAWRTLLRDAAGKTLEDSNWLPDDGIDAFAYGMTKAVGSAGGFAVVRVMDDVQRVSTPGDPDYLEQVLPFTVQASGIPTPLAHVTASQAPPRPWVRLTGTRAEIPDAVAILRNSGSGLEHVATVPGDECFVGDMFSWTDYSMPMNRLAVYEVRAVVNGFFSNAVTDSITPRCKGIWLVDDDGENRGADVVVWGDGEQSQESPEIAVEHTPLSDDGVLGEVVRRRLARYAPQGTLEGSLAGALGVTAEECEARLQSWSEEDAGHHYRLVLGNLNLPVILGNIVVSEVPQNGAERLAEVSLSWWTQS